MFEEFWKSYPRRVGKLDAHKAWRTLKVTPAMFDQMTTALAWQVASRDWTRDGGQFVPYPATWLRAGRWMDEAPSSARRDEWCHHEPRCAHSQEHTRRWLDEQKAEQERAKVSA